MSSTPAIAPSRRLSISPSLRRDLFALFALLVLTLLFFWKLALTNLIIARGDIFYYFYPYRDYASLALRAGRIPLWNPYLFMGAPFLANSQVGFFYPFNLLMSWLDVTRSISWTIVLHIFIAASGVYVFTRSRLKLSILAAWLAAISFGLGGYLGTQIEHVNQLQGLAWIGWIFLAYDLGIRDQGSGIRQLRSFLFLSLVISLQLLAGHTQSVFITLFGLGMYAIWPAMEFMIVTLSGAKGLSLSRQRFFASLRMTVLRLFPIFFASIFAALLSAIQLLPTFELTRLSARSGGLPTNLAVSFSLDPRLLGRSLLPDYSGALPSGGEFTAFFGVAAIVLMLYGLLSIWSRRLSSNIQHPASNFRSICIVALVGLLLALGGYTPIYYALLKIFPGFDLFRAPARWIVLFAFAGSIVAGVGLDSLRDRKINLRSVLLPIVILASLILLTFISSGLTPAGASGPIGIPDVASLSLWIIACVLTIVFIKYSSLVTHYSLLVTVACLELFLATRSLPYNSHATAPDALTDLRSATAHLLVGAQDRTPPDRFLSISDIFFDPGDSAELKSIFGDQLSSDAYYDLIIATKLKEIVAPNLPVYYRLPAVDGYDGGLLPLKNYMTFQQLFLDPSLIQSDGRLREQLKSIPDARWLDLMNVRYIVTDKVGDQWYDGVLYDLQFTTPLAPGETATTSQLPTLNADAIGVIYAEPSGNSTLAKIDLVMDDNTTQTLMLTNPCEGSVSLQGLTECQLTWGAPHRIKSIRVTGIDGVTIHGLALIDLQSKSFQSFVLAPQGQFKLAHSGDVKVYENVNVQPRAFFVANEQTVTNDEEAISLMKSNQFDPARAVVLIGNQNSNSTDHLVTLSSSHLVTYEPEHIVVDVNAQQDGYLVLTDAYYPGWVATVDDQPAEIDRADVLFRAVKVPAGQHRIEMRYDPQSYKIGSIVSLVSWIALIVLFIATRRRVIIAQH
jgi:Bacterial membrane protein YfhO